jgi:glycosyltransferase involved in cell wall biosynthesis
MFDIPSSRLIIGNVARAHPMKNHEGFVRTLALLRKDGCDVHGLIIGDGHEEGRARQTARDLGVSDYLTTPGLRSDIAELLPGIDVFFLSSAWGEAFPLSVGEAMACGVPAVVTDVGDCDWLVGDPKMVAKPDDLEEQTALVRNIVNMTDTDRRELGVAARTRVLQNFSLQKYTESHIRLYQAAIDERTRPGGAR